MRGDGGYVEAQIKVYDSYGNDVRRSVNEKKSAGEYEVQIDMTGLNKEIYFYQIYAGYFVSVRKMIELT